MIVTHVRQIVILMIVTHEGQIVILMIMTHVGQIIIIMIVTHIGQIVIIMIETHVSQLVILMIVAHAGQIVISMIVTHVGQIVVITIMTHVGQIIMLMIVNGILKTLFSYHYSLFCILKNNRNNITVTGQEFTEQNIYKLNKMLSKEDWKTVYRENDASYAFLKFQKQIYISTIRESFESIEITYESKFKEQKLIYFCCGW